MRKLPTASRLGSALRSHRKERGLSQAGLATSAGLTEKTLRQLEQGKGNLNSWQAALELLGLEVVGRNLQPGDSLGSSIASLRRRRRLGQREVDELVGVSQPTIVALEGQGGGGVSTRSSGCSRRSGPGPTSPHAGRARRSTRTPGMPR